MSIIKKQDRQTDKIALAHPQHMHVVSETANQESLHEPSKKDFAAAPSPARITTMSLEPAPSVTCTLSQLRRCLRPCQINDHAACKLMRMSRGARSQTSRRLPAAPGPARLTGMSSS
ncbi:hypothetical protein M431DRAFT_170689 [Trichoderma harzianum CBS 226.95]|jgi:hypothetical protein|uniref:Uncharacterized protein n=1 Tax=Trichoderma harzianum CBS 226.95 TaxID=983964 RepID=A0A2T4ASH6_TRIHA|nr:hypothetical protein M431DRAFT_170689 [Trichoderma harzianum CBS 226.95]PTB60011.1 hypothetical protein M431DRAFT_170689 [Trichoderma harzianum CBS 226.95]